MLKVAQKKNTAAVQLGKLRKEKGPSLSAIGTLGGKASMEGRSAEQREEFARLGGLAGGKARAKALTRAERVEIAKKAAAARWGKKTD